MPIVYDLTPLTRGAAAQRRVVIKTVEVRHQRLMVIFLALIPAAIVTALAWQLIGTAALLVFVAVQAAAIWLFDTRSQRGLRQTNLKALRQRVRAQNGVFMVAGVAYNPLSGHMGELVPGTVWAPPENVGTERRIHVEEEQW